MKVTDGLFVLQVSLAIQVHCLDVGDPTLFRGLQENQIGWKPFILIYLDNLANLESIPPIILESLTLPLNPLNLLLILDVVLRAPLEVLKQVLNHRNENDWDEADKRRGLAICDRD